MYILNYMIVEKKLFFEKRNYFDEKYLFEEKISFLSICGIFCVLLNPEKKTFVSL